MYHEERKITVFSNASFLEQIIQQSIKEGPISYHICTSPCMDNGWHDSDIVVCDLPVRKLEHYRKQMKKNSYLFYVCDSVDEVCLDRNAAADELLMRPLSKPYVQKRIERIFAAEKASKDLWLASTYLDVLIDSMPDLVWFKDNEGIHVKVNRVFCHTVGKDRKKIVGKDHCAVWDVKTNDCEETEKIVRQKQKTCEFNELVQSRNGMRQFRTYKSPLFDGKGGIMGTVGIGHDVTDLENMSAEIEILLSSMPFAILVKDQNDAIINVNKKFEEYFDVYKHGVVGKSYQNWYENEFLDHEIIKKNDSEEIHSPGPGIEQVLEVIHEPIYDVFKSDVGELCIYRDITEEFLLKQQLSNNSNTDFLTGLCNRRHFYECIAEPHNYDQISILYVDLDHFKLVNDTYGHQIGDEALILVADVLNTCFPEDLIARLGGDEFLVSKTTLITEEELIKQAQALIKSLRQEFDNNSCYDVLSASIGISYTKDPEKKIDTLIKESDQALYQAKQTGRSKCCVYHD